MKTVQQRIEVSSHTSIQQKLLGPAVLFLLAILFYWKLVLTNQFTWLENSELAKEVLPWLQYQAGLWHHGHFPLWDPYQGFGQTLFGLGDPGAAYPFNWLLFLVPLKHGWIRQAALHWYYVLIHYFAALSCYALARDLGRTRAASILAGCVYGLGGYVASMNSPQMINGAVWSPLVILFLLRVWRGVRPWPSAILSGFFLGFAWLAGDPQMNLLVSLAAGGMWIWFTVRGGRINLRMTRMAAASLAIAFMASCFQTLPMAAGEIVPYTAHEQSALRPMALLGIVTPNISQTYSPYIGICAFALGILGIVLAWRESIVRWLAALSLGGILFALGPESLLHGVLYSLGPLIEKARAPAAAIVVFALGFAPLVAYGADRLTDPESFLWSRRAGWWLLGLAAALTLVEIGLWAAKATGANDDRVMITALAAALLAAILAGWRGGEITARTGIAAATALVLFELANAGSYQLPNRNVPAQNPYLHRMTEHGDIAAYIRNRGIAARANYDSNEIPYNFGDWFGIETTDASGSSSPRIREFFGVRYYLAKTAPSGELTEVFRGRSGVNVYEDILAYPRVWSVHQAAFIRDAGQARATIAAADFDARNTVLLASGPAPDLAQCDSRADNVQMPYHGPNQVTITADLQCRGMVILTDAWYPGWHATVDGKSAPIERAYGEVRGVIADAGPHVIQMSYRPLSIILGGALTALAALIAGYAAFAGSRSREI